MEHLRTTHHISQDFDQSSYNYQVERLSMPCRVVENDWAVLRAQITAIVSPHLVILRECSLANFA